ncbi:MAG: sensor domain-containing diguanylate cyclase [Nitrospiraceae bacterium]|nr:MAG: sensor domain-containing diguanylate cyclase [Nitrospiraceae bacterium]
MILNQVFDAINIGIVILDREMKVKKWNRWMEINSGINADKILDSSVYDFFPDLENPKFIRSCKSVFSFGNFCFFSQKLHKHLFQFKSSGYLNADFEFMQQNCAMGPLRNEENEIQYLFIYVQDVTEVAVYERKLIEMNMKDGLTGIYNRRYLESRLKEEFSRHKRYSGNFSVIMFDLDHFKDVNDEHGHQCGDFILKSVCARISSIIRNIDIFARYGGEEFCCLLPETSKDGAIYVAERFREAIEEQDNHFDDLNIKVTISLGVANLKDNISSPEMLLKMADDALYRAKNEGRNRVECGK